MNVIAAPDVRAARSIRFTTIGAICDEFGGEVQTGPFGSQLHASDYSVEGTPVVMPQDMVDGRIVTDKIARVSQEHVVRLPQHRLQAGDIVYSRRGDVSRFAIVTEAESGWLCGTGSIRVRLNSPDFHIRYLRRFLQQDSVRSWLENEAKGVTMLNLNTSIIRNLPIAFPPLDEQRRIAAILDQADALRAKRRMALTQVDEMARAIFVEMFGDPATNPRGWAVRPLAELCSIAGQYGAGVPAIDADPTLPRYIRITDINDDGTLQPDSVSPGGTPADWSDLYLLDGDVLFARSGATVGKTFLYSASIGPAVFAGYLIRFRPAPNQLLPAFLFNFTKTQTYTDWVISRQRVVAQPNINAKQYGGELMIPVPPIALQHDFEARIAALGLLKDQHAAAMKIADVLFTSLQHRAFRSEL